MMFEEDGATICSARMPLHAKNMEYNAWMTTQSRNEEKSELPGYCLASRRYVLLKLDERLNGGRWRTSSPSGGGSVSCGWGCGGRQIASGGLRVILV